MSCYAAENIMNITSITLNKESWDEMINSGKSNIPTQDDLDRFYESTKKYAIKYNYSNLQLKEIFQLDLNPELTEEQVTYLTTVRDYILLQLNQ